MEIFDTFNRPLRDLRISVIDACNFRCSYCMPVDRYGEDYAFMKPADRLSNEQLLKLVEAFGELGVKKIRLTGGEPLLRKDICEFISKIKDNNKNIEEIALTTNGYYLEESAEKLKKAGLDRLTVSLDTLDPDKAYFINGKKDILPKILSGLETASKTGFKKIKINCVVQKDINDNEILDLVEYFRNKSFIVRFIEFMDVGTRNHWEMSKVVPSAEIRDLIHAKHPLKSMAPQYSGEVAARYQLMDDSGEVGFISSVTQPFCQSCTRARITADGTFYTCLFASKGQELKPALHSENSLMELKKIITHAWEKRSDKYSEERQLSPKNSPKIEMNHIGG